MFRLKLNGDFEIGHRTPAYQIEKNIRTIESHISKLIGTKLN